MRLLVVTNLYPPQELGGYGRAMADFVWGLQQRGHHLQIVTSDSAYLNPSTTAASNSIGPSGELVCRRLQLKGSYQGGVQGLSDPGIRASIDQANIQLLRNWLRFSWDAVLLGNLDLLGVELLSVLLEPGIPVLHHVGFVSAPFHPQQMPHAPNYHLIAASKAVREGLVAAGLPVGQAPVVYPGARTELFGTQVSGHPAAVSAAVALANAGFAWGSPANPLKLGFAGLMMASKGAHTVVEALISLHQQGITVQAAFAGGSFQTGYREQLELMLNQAGLSGAVRFVGQLARPQLARFWALHQVGVFGSIHPEAFGIVAAEIMASGLALLTTGVGGAAELIEPGKNGLLFEAGNGASLVKCLQQLLADPGLLQNLACNGEQRVKDLFSVDISAMQLEQLSVSSAVFVL